MEYTEINPGLLVSCKKYNIIKGRIINKLEHSYTKVYVKDIDRGPGWDENTQTYKGCKFKGGWGRGQNHGYGDEHIIHIKDLTIINLEK